MGKKRWHSRDPLPLRRLPTPAEIARFLSKIKIGKIPKRHQSPCWEWQGRRNDKGYGQFKFDHKSEQAHRFSFQGLRQKKMKKGRHVHHTCLNSCCVNPNHLADTTPRYNGQEGAERRWKKLPVVHDDIPI